MSLDKPSNAEDEYFLREEIARKKLEALEQAKKIQKEERTKQQELHYMKCPKCGFDLKETKLKEVTIDKCYHCGGLWLDANELEQLITQKEPNLFQRIIEVFRHDDSQKHP